jgi:N6-L-threonylcarbamoyladenine synthase
MKVLGIETSCDETAAAVIEDGYKMLSNVVASSVDLHSAYGGVVPEIAARSHLEVITPVVEEALTNAHTPWEEIDAIAFTYGPGLGGSLLVGAMTARTLAVVKDKPLYPINHVEAHIYANFITESGVPGYRLPSKAPALPLLALIVSGGHSHLVLLKDHRDYQVIGRTLDDAVGEAFDKVAKLLGLPYPGGPSIAEAAKNGNPEAFRFPKANAPGEYNFSFSGLKTAVLRVAQAQAGKDYTFPSSGVSELLNEAQKADIAASFQCVALETLVDTLKRAYEDFKPAGVVIGGGVAANQELRRLVKEQMPLEVEYTDTRLCTDNGAMIGALGFYEVASSPAPQPVDIDPNLSM